MLKRSRTIDVIVADGGRPTLPWGVVGAVEERYRPLVERLQQEALSTPLRYRFKVLLAAALGYVVIGTLFATLFAAAAFILWDMISREYVNVAGIVFVPMVGTVLFDFARALSVRAEPPKGFRPTKKEAPRLFSEIEEIRARLDGPRVHEILVSFRFNASIVQYPRLGIFGWHRNCLTLGLPLLQAMPLDEVRAIIAHELGHIAGRHGRFTSYVHRIRTRWLQLSQQLPPGWLARILRSFFRWYGPWFNAYSFATARKHEYDADQAAARATDARTLASSLVRLQIESDRFDRYWDELHKKAGSTPTPNHEPHAELRQLFRTPVASHHAERSLRRALAEVTDLEDIHPSTSDRIAALGMIPTLPPHPEHSAEEILLGPYGADIGASLDDSWSFVSEDWWLEKYEQRQSNMARLDRLRAKAAVQVLGRWDRRLHASLVHELEGGLAALPLYDALALEEPDDTELALVTSSIRLANDDPDGVKIAERLAIDNPLHASAILMNLSDFHRRNGDAEAAGRVEDQLSKTLAREKAEEEEFLTLSRSTVFYPPTYSERERREIQQALAEAGCVKMLLVGFRTLEYRNEHQQVVLFVPTRGVDREDVSETVTSIFAPYGARLVCTYGSQIRWLRDKLADVEGALLYA